MNHIHKAAERGRAGGGSPLPYFDRVQKSFGRHDISGVKSHSGPAASEATHTIGAEAYASGDDVVFGASPDLHIVAHEAAHIVQQRRNIQLSDNIGKRGDRFERHADEVADAVVKGESAEALLDTMTPGGASSAPGAQRKAVQLEGPGRKPTIARAEAEREAAARPSRARGFEVQMREIDPSAGSDKASIPDASPAAAEQCSDVPKIGNECAPDAGHVEVSQLSLEAAKALMELAIQSGKYFDRLLRRQQLAWGALFAQAGRSPYIALSEGDYRGMVYASTAVGEGSAFASARGSVASAVGNTALEGIAGVAGANAVRKMGVRRLLNGQEGKGIAALSGLLKAFRGSGVPGFVFSTVVGIVWDVISGFISPDPDAGELVDAGIADSQNARTAVEESIIAEGDAQKTEALSAIQRAHDFVLACHNRDALRTVLEWAIQNLAVVSILPAPEDPVLGKSLLRQWVLQHSATPNEANKDTTHRTFTKLKAKLKEPLNGRSDLFIHQCTYAWGRMGVDIARMAARLEKALLPHKGKSPTDVADAFEGFTLSLDPIQDGPRFAAYLSREQPLDGPFASRHRIPEDPERAAKNRTFSLTCTLSLKEADGAVCLDALDFELLPHPGYNAWQLEPRSYINPHAPQLSAIASRQWDYAPR